MVARTFLNPRWTRGEPALWCGQGNCPGGDLSVSACRRWAVGRGEAQAGGDGLDRVVEVFEERFPASVPVAVDPGAGGESEGEGDDLGQDVQPEVFWVEAELARQARDHLVLNLGAVVLD